MNLPNKLTTIRLISVPLFVIIYLIPYQMLGISMPTFDILSTELITFRYYFIYYLCIICFYC